MVEPHGRRSHGTFGGHQYRAPPRQWPVQLASVAAPVPLEIQIAGGLSPVRRAAARDHLPHRALERTRTCFRCSAAVESEKRIRSRCALSNGCGSTMADTSAATMSGTQHYMTEGVRYRAVIQTTYSNGYIPLTLTLRQRSRAGRWAFTCPQGNRCVSPVGCIEVWFLGRPFHKCHCSIC